MIKLLFIQHGSSGYHKKGWLEKILSGKKTVESRWYKHKKAPFMAIDKGI